MSALLCFLLWMYTIQVSIWEADDCEQIWMKPYGSGAAIVMVNYEGIAKTLTCGHECANYTHKKDVWSSEISNGIVECTLKAGESCMYLLN